MGVLLLGEGERLTGGECLLLFGAIDRLMDLLLLGEGERLTARLLLTIGDGEEVC